MKNKKKVIDPLPESFASEQEAGNFWDSHSAADYLEYLEPTEDEIAIENRVFEVRVSEDVFKSLRNRRNQPTNRFRKPLTESCVRSSRSHKRPAI